MEDTYLILLKHAKETEHLLLYHVIETYSMGKSDLGIESELSILLKVAAGRLT